MAEENTIKYIRVVKECVGAISFTIVNPETGIKQIVSIPADGTDRVLPISWAACVYQDMASGAYKMYKSGYFTFDDPDAVYSYAYEHNLIMGDVTVKAQPVSASYLDDLKKALINNNTMVIDKAATTAKGKDDLVHVARENLGDLKESTKRYVEKLVGVSLTAEAEDDIIG